MNVLSEVGRNYFYQPGGAPFQFALPFMNPAFYQQNLPLPFDRRVWMESQALRDAFERNGDGIFAVGDEDNEEIFHLSRRGFRLNGRRHELVLLRQLTAELRRQEVQTWKKVIRVISHELNNSLAPIKSMAGTLRALTARDPLPEDWRDDLLTGLNLIGEKRIEQDKFITKHFRVDENKFADRLMAIEVEAEKMLASNDAQEVLAGKRLLQTTMQNLSARMTNKISSNALNLVAGVVSYIGVAMLFTPVPAAGFGILALSGAISMAVYIRDRRDTRDFEKAIGL